jgi:hypothetical protein
MTRRLALALLAFSMIGFSQALANPIEIFGMAYVENSGRFTVAPGGGENLDDPAAGNQYRIHLQIWDSNGDALAGVPATELWLHQPHLVPCPGIFCQADGPTDLYGRTTFSGTIYGGLAGDAQAGVDCNQTRLYVVALGMVINDGEPVNVAFDSPDLDRDLSVWLPDFAIFAQDFNCEQSGQPCDPCHDFNEDGRTSIEDFALFAGYLNDSVCP